MHRYDVYLLKPEIANDFVQMEQKLFKLFQEYETRPNFRRELKKQVKYITRPLPMAQLRAWLKGGEVFASASTDGRQMIYYMKERIDIRMTVTKERVQIWSEPGIESEWFWFDKLKAYDPYFFACDTERGKYGWLAPVKFSSLLCSKA